MISNNYCINDNIREIDDVDDIISKELQKYIYNENNFLNKYLTKRDSEIFKKIKFYYTYLQIDNICGNVDIWNYDYKSIKEFVKFNTCHLSESLLYILVTLLTQFISITFDKKENNKIIY